MASRGIPEDLVVEILKRLPVKSLLRFKATSKRWYALISCRNFIKSHLASISAPDRVLILNHSRNRQFFLFPDDDVDDESQAVNLNTDGVESVIDFNQFWGFISCDGIVCLFRGYMTSPIIPITFWNPATKKFKSLPTSSYSASIDKINSSSLRYWVGFGFDSKTDDYKVVVLVYVWGEGPKPIMNYAEVYSLKTNSWRVIDAANAPILYSGKLSTYTQGVCYWVASRDDVNDIVSFDMEEEVNDIVSFDMEEEVFRVTPAPPPKLPDESSPDIEIASSNESLVVMYYSYYSPIEVWVTKDLLTLGGDCWTLEYILEPPGVPTFYELCLHPLGLWKNCLLFIQCTDLLQYSVPEECDMEFCLYNPGTGEIRNLQFPGEIARLMTYSYKETLVSLA